MNSKNISLHHKVDRQRKKSKSCMFSRLMYYKEFKKNANTNTYLLSLHWRVHKNNITYFTKCAVFCLTLLKETFMLRMLFLGDACPLKNRKKQKLLLLCNIVQKFKFVNRLIYFFNTYITIFSLFSITNMFDFESQNNF